MAACNILVSRAAVLYPVGALSALTLVTGNEWLGCDYCTNAGDNDDDDDDDSLLGSMAWWYNILSSRVITYSQRGWKKYVVMIVHRIRTDNFSITLNRDVKKYVILVDRM